MIKPYVVKSNDSGNNWSINLNSSWIREPKRIGVKDSVFAVFGYGPRWVIVNTETDTEITCGSNERCQEILDSLGVSDLKFYDVNFVFDMIVGEGKLPPEWPQKENR